MFDMHGRHILMQCAAGAVVCFAFAATWASMPVAAQEATRGAPPDSGLVLKIQTNEVVLDVVARDRHNNVVADLKQDEFEVFDVDKHSVLTPHRILWMRTIDPHMDESRAGSEESGFKISTGAVCVLNVLTHYELAVSASAAPGYHQVVVKTNRKDVSLSFRNRYYVGPTPSGSQAAAPVSSKGRNPAREDTALGEAACFHPLVPPTLAITAHPTATPGGNGTSYLVVVRPESLAGIGLTGPDSIVKLDYGMSTFDATGRFVKYKNGSLDRTVSAADFDRVQAYGLGTLLEVPGKDPPYLARFVVRERETGNLGIVDVSRPVSIAEQAEKGKTIARPMGSIRSLGTVTPRENTFCGDVYELPPGTERLPDFWDLNPVGSIYNDMLNVPNQDITAEGIPGITRNNTWFGVDYWGEFYVTDPGDYIFSLDSDDGSKLEIDNQLLIDLDGVHQVLGRAAHVNLQVGRHTIHVPYFQGPPDSLALILRVKAPDGKMRPFNLTEYAEPKAAR
jgi:hypothetical protein